MCHSGIRIQHIKLAFTEYRSSFIRMNKCSLLISDTLGTLKMLTEFESTIDVKIRISNKLSLIS